MVQAVTPVVSPGYGVTQRSRETSEETGFQQKFLNVRRLTLNDLADEIVG
jgi:hypothetical protein